MHELAVCEALFAEARRIAENEGAAMIDRLVVTIGPLSGVEAELLVSAFSIARAGAGFPEAELEVETAPVRVQCSSCGATNDVAPNRLVCADCGDWRVTLLSGSEMILKSVELSGVPERTLH